MHHDTALINMIAIGLGLAFVLGALANKLRLSPLVGYLIAGVIVGPFTPGFVADQALANQLAEIGVMLLMFGVGLHFSLKDLMAVKAIAIPGAIGQILVATLLGWGVATLMGWPALHGVIFGFSLATASTTSRSSLLIVVVTPRAACRPPDCWRNACRRPCRCRPWPRACPCWRANSGWGPGPGRPSRAPAGPCRCCRRPP